MIECGASHGRARWARAACVCALAGVIGCMSVTLQARELGIGVVFDPEDARYDAKHLEKNYPGQPLGRPKAGAALAIAESEFSLAQANVQISLVDVAIDSVDDAHAKIEALAKKGVRHFLLDLPGPAVEGVSKAMQQRDVLLFNVSAPDAKLRRAACSANLFHTLPDESMSADAMAQFLIARKWNRILLLTSAAPADQPLVTAAQNAIKRYGLKLVAAKNFKLSNDPRERDMANVALLTAGIDADVVWVVDGDGEFAREVPYKTVLPRPVVGSAGLVAEGWHASWERHGAPQLNRRFRKATNRVMAAEDWAAWMATKAIIDVALRIPDAREQRRALRSQDLVLDGFKGARLSFRPWDQQLRQPVFLAHGGIGGGIAGVAPFEGFLHPKNNLDTLGADEKESPCKLTDAPTAPPTPTEGRK
jgi:ABC transporter substrate binding protein (PQQ-dependent alcohol dehydrogenase system)